MLVSEFITLVRQEGKLTSQFLDADICALADSEIASRFIPLVRNVHSDYFVREAQIDSVDGRVRLPDRAIAGTLRHAQIVVGGIATALPLFPLEQDYLGNPASSIPNGYYMDAGGMVLLPRGTNGTVRIRYFQRPSKMRTEGGADMQRITNVTYSLGVATCTVANVWSTALLDVVSGGPNHELLAEGVTSAVPVVVPIANQLGGVIQRTSDWACQTGYTPFVPLPEELYSALVHQTAAAYMRAMGYIEESQAHQREAEMTMESAKLILAPRNEGNIKVMKGGMRLGIGSNWGGWGRW